MNILWYIAIAFVLALVSAVILNLLGRTKRFGKIELIKNVRHEPRIVTGVALTVIWLFWPIVLLLLAVVVPFAIAAWLIGIASGGHKKDVE